MTLEEVSKTHKYNLATSISKVADNYHSEIIELDNFQYFDCSDFDEDIASNIIGTITGMVLGYCNWKKPILGFSKPRNNQIKVSLRCSKLLAYDGIHFGNMMREIVKRSWRYRRRPCNSLRCFTFQMKKNQNSLINLIENYKEK